MARARFKKKARPAHERERNFDMYDSVSVVSYVDATAGAVPGEAVVEDESAAWNLTAALGEHSRLFRIRHLKDPERMPGNVLVGDATQVVVADAGTARALECVLKHGKELASRTGLMRLLVNLSKSPVPDELFWKIVERFTRLLRQVEWRDGQIKDRDALIDALCSASSLKRDSRTEVPTS